MIIFGAVSTNIFFRYGSLTAYKPYLLAYFNHEINFDVYYYKIYYKFLLSIILII